MRCRAFFLAGFTVILATALFCSEASVAQVLGEEPEKEARENSLRDGSWSVQFQLGRELTLSTFGGMAISVKRHVSRTSAFRIGVNLDLNYEDLTNQYTSVTYDTTVYTDESIIQYNSQMVQLDLLYMNYPNPDGYVNLFFGGGPLVRFARSRKETESTATRPGDTRRRTTETYSRSWSLGVLGLMGVEWFLSKNFSFHAEYRAFIAYKNGNSSSKSIYYYPDSRRQTSESSSDGWEFEGLAVLLGLSVYF